MLVAMFALAGLCLLVSVVLALFLVIWAALMGVIKLIQLFFALFSTEVSENTLELSEITSGAVADRS